MVGSKKGYFCISKRSETLLKLRARKEDNDHTEKEKLPWGSNMGWDPEQVKRLALVRRMESSSIENRKKTCLEMKVSMLVRGEEAN